jgi:hypothetical protein
MEKVFFNHFPMEQFQNTCFLTKLEAKVIKVFGEKAANKEVVPEIQNLIGALEKQEFSPPP